MMRTDDREDVCVVNSTLTYSSLVNVSVNLNAHVDLEMACKCLLRQLGPSLGHREP